MYDTSTMSTREKLEYGASIMAPIPYLAYCAGRALVEGAAGLVQGMFAGETATPAGEQNAAAEPKAA
jgi:hypothetical protein